MNTRKSIDDVMRDMNELAKSQGRYLATPFSEIARSPGSLLDRADTPESDDRIRKAQEYIAARQAQVVPVGAVRQKPVDDDHESAR